MTAQHKSRLESLPLCPNPRSDPRSTCFHVSCVGLARALRAGHVAGVGREGGEPHL